MIRYGFAVTNLRYSLANFFYAFLYKHVLRRDVALIEGVTRAKSPANLPVVLTRDELRALLQRIQGREWLMASLMYGSGLRLRECVSIRVKDVDFGFQPDMGGYVRQRRRLYSGKITNGKFFPGRYL